MRVDIIGLADSSSGGSRGKERTTTQFRGNVGRVKLCQLVLPQRNNKRHKQTNLTRPTGLINIRPDHRLPFSSLPSAHKRPVAPPRSAEITSSPVRAWLFALFLFDTLKGKVWRHRTLHTKQIIHLLWSLNNPN